MKRTLHVIVGAIASVIVLGSIASASPALRASLTADASTETGASGVTDPTGITGAAGSAGHDESADVDESEDVTESTGVTGATGFLDATGATGALDTSEGTGPDFSGCVGLKGLDNAICRHEVLLAGDPTNPGLLNSLAHLQANAAKHLSDATSVDSTVDGSSTSDTASCPGHSRDAHGQSGESHGNSDGSQGHGNGND